MKFRTKDDHTRAFGVVLDRDGSFLDPETKQIYPVRFQKEVPLASSKFHLIADLEDDTLKILAIDDLPDGKDGFTFSCIGHTSEDKSVISFAVMPMFIGKENCRMDESGNIYEITVSGYTMHFLSGISYSEFIQNEVVILLAGVKKSEETLLSHKSFLVSVEDIVKRQCFI